MSVINQMLKELDQRKTTNNGGPAIMLPVSKYGDSEKSLAFKIVTLSLFIISIVVISISGYRYLTNVEPVSEQPTEPTTDSSVESEKIIIAEQQKVTAPDINNTATNAITQTVDNDKAVPEVDNNEIEQETVLENNSNLANTIPNEQSVLQPTEAVPHKFVKSKTEVDLKTQAEQLYQSARREVDTSRLGAAQQLLSKAIQIHPPYHKARVLLFSLLLQQNKLDLMRQQLTQSLEQWPEVHEYRQLRARLLITTGKQPEALSVLQQNIPAVKDAEDYHALLAYVAQQLNSDQLAAKHYQLLLQQHPGRADWWLGMAVSEERLGNKAVALQAYQQSIGRPGLSQSVREYARQRIKVLQGF